MDNAVHYDMALNNVSPRRPRTPATISLQTQLLRLRVPKNKRLQSSTTTKFEANSMGCEVDSINFNLSAEGPVRDPSIGQPRRTLRVGHIDLTCTGPYKPQVCLRNIRGKAAQNLSIFKHQNLHSLVVFIFSNHTST